LYPLLVAFCGEFSISLIVSGHRNLHVREHCFYIRDPVWIRSSETLSTYQKRAYAAASTGASPRQATAHWAVFNTKSLIFGFKSSYRPPANKDTAFWLSSPS
jgi:hypothetical protein